MALPDGGALCILRDAQAVFPLLREGLRSCLRLRERGE